MTDLIVKYSNDTDKIPITLYQDDGITPDNLSLYNNILVYIKNLETNEEVAKYSMNALSGFNNTDFKVIDAANGEFQINVQNSIIVTMKPGIYKLVFELRKTNTDFTDGYEKETLEEVYLERK